MECHFQSTRVLWAPTERSELGPHLFNAMLRPYPASREWKKERPQKRSLSPHRKINKTGRAARNEDCREEWAV